MGDTDALRDKIAQAIAEKFTSPTRVVTRGGKRYDPITLEDYTEAVPMGERIEQGAWVVFEAVDGLRSLRAANSYEIADAVLPVVKAHQEALASEPASHVIRRAIRSAAEARTELQVLREAVAHLADQLDKRSDETAATYRASGDRAFFGDSITRRELAQRLRRSLSDNKEQQ